MRTNQPFGTAFKRAGLCVFMKELSLNFGFRRNKTLTSLQIAAVMLLSVLSAKGQITGAPTNIYQPWTSDKFSALTVTSSKAAGFDEFLFKGNVIDNDANADNPNSASWTALAGGGSAWLEVKDGNAGTAGYPAGTYAGFVVSAGSLANITGNSITITTYLTSKGPSNAQQLQNTYTASDAALAISLLSSSGKIKVGFVTDLPFDRVRITIQNGAGLLPTWRIYYGELVRAGAYSDPSCSTKPLVQSDYPSVVTTGTTGALSVDLLGGVFNATGNVVDGSATNPATITLPLVNFATTAYISVREAGGATQYHHAGLYAGFEIGQASLLGLGVLSNSTISTYLKGQPKESFSGAALLVSAPVLTAAGKSTIGFVTTQDFDEVRYTLNQGVNVNLGTVNVYRAVIRNFCERPTGFSCNTLYELDSKIDPVYINMANTKVTGAVSLNNNIANLDQLIDGNPNTAATIKSLLVNNTSVLSQTSVSVKKALAPYTPGSNGYYVAFDVESQAVLLDAAVLSTATVTTYLNGAPQQSSTGGGLLIGTKSTLISGSGTPNRQKIGLVATSQFDEVRLTFNQPINASLGDVNIYGIEVENLCTHSLDCNTTNVITNSPSGFGAIIDNERSGVTGLVCANCNIQNISNVVDDDATSAAKIFVTAGALSTYGIAVQVPGNTFPAGTVAGFRIRTNNTSLVGLDLLKYLKIETFNNGMPAESRTGGELLGLDLLTLPIIGGSNAGMYNIGFKTSMPYDEIRISTTNVVGAGVIGDKDLDIFYATVDTRYMSSAQQQAAGMSCSLVYTLPDINYTTINKSVKGSVATNDVKPANNITYLGGTLVAGANGQTSPAGSNPQLTLQSGGDYTFVTDKPGVYSYSTTMRDANTNPATDHKENLTIIVTDPAITTNPPVVNTDVAAVLSNDGSPGYAGVIIPVLANDKPSNAGATGLSNPTVPAAGATGGPQHGTVQVNPDGTITYKPDPGFVGTDIFTYTTCEQPNGSPCGTAYVEVKVTPRAIPPDAPDGNIVAADDYTQIKGGKTVTGNVKTNDSDPLDPSGNSLTVTTQNSNAYGSFSLASDGTFTFSPAVDFSGTAVFPYRVSGSGSRSAYATLYVYVIPSGLNTLPDNNVGFKDLDIKGNVSTNDHVPSGTTYGTPVAIGTPPGTPTTFSMNTNGVYTFKSGTIGVYKYNVPVTNDGITVNELLTITILDPAISTNPPVVMNDVAKTTGTTPVAIQVNDNDKPGNTGGKLSPPEIKTNPAHGNVVVNAADSSVTYTLTDAGFTGKDMFTYESCETPGGKCSIAEVVVTVIPAGTVTASAADDYMTAAKGSADVAGNVSTNDGPNQNVTTGTFMDASNNKLEITNANGDYKFTPSASFTGTAVFEYTTCTQDGSSCTKATLYVTVKEESPDLVARITMTPNNIIGKSDVEIKVGISEINNIATNGLITLYVDKSNLFGDFSFDNNAVKDAANQPVNNNEFSVDAVSNPDSYVITTNSSIKDDMKWVTFKVKADPKTTAGQGSLTVFVKTGSGGEKNNANNSYSTSIVFSFIAP
ncbi:Ig-like domain-containing protein [Niabella drilacis]|uniref:Tandem-95 repeat protein n=1 Tax=Niabella drilacis (strain DSM 25811 / CCM 8410 / CCUG 62505 / LMG 26954 / E90) TaxID=1285928 RepID=A0A1G7A0D1_NIADE|nr:Ig-like domain-containing protein [Niabella drilacis]SDE08230.1 hypothetical protein SAMN04487894_12034 [Niabella drilacis]